MGGRSSQQRAALVAILLCSRFGAPVAEERRERTEVVRRGGGTRGGAAGGVQSVAVAAVAVAAAESSGTGDADAAVEAGLIGRGRRRRAQASCVDVTDRFEYMTDQGQTPRAKCKNIANVNNGGEEKLRKKCERFLTDGTERRVMDVCPVTCGNCPDSAPPLETRDAATVAVTTEAATTTTTTKATTQAATTVATTTQTATTEATTTQAATTVAATTQATTTEATTTEAPLVTTTTTEAATTEVPPATTTASLETGDAATVAVTTIATTTTTTQAATTMEAPLATSTTTEAVTTEAPVSTTVATVVPSSTAAAAAAAATTAAPISTSTTVAASSSSTTTTTSVALSTATTAYGPEVSRQINSGRACPLPPHYDSESSVLMAVTNREVYMGCHSFEEYLSPNFHTVFILNEDVVLEWGIDDMVRDATCAESLGATVLMTKNFGGEIQGRKLAMDFLEVVYPETEFLMQMNCDVHAIPTTHQWYETVESSVLKASHDFHMARVQRMDLQDGEAQRLELYPNAPNYPPFALVDNLNARNDKLTLPILSMSFHLHEGFESNTDLVQHFHGVDGCKWQSGHGRQSRPSNFGGPSQNIYPWLCTGERMENHALMFDVTNLRLVRNEYFDTPYDRGVRCFASDTRFSPRFALEQGMVAVTHRDVHFHQDFAKTATGGSPRVDTMAKYDAALQSRGVTVDKDWIRALSWGSLGYARGPSMVYGAFHAFSDVELPRFGGTGVAFAARHSHEGDGPWIPTNIQGKALSTDRVAGGMLVGVMKLFGYELYDKTGGAGGRLSFRIEALYPSDIHVTMSDGTVNCNDCWTFMEIIESGSGQMLSLTAHGGVTWKEIKEMEPEDRTIVIPPGATVGNFYGPSEAVGMEYLDVRGRHKPDSSSSRCRVPDLDKLDSCGYEETTSFDTAY